jgi:hypothetical protein
MRRRGLRIAILVFVTLWFGVLVPIHTRGQIPIPGDCSAQSDWRQCCARTHRGDSHSRLPVRPHACGVCYVIATLDLPPELILYVPPPSPSEPVDRVAPVIHVSIAARTTCLERAPPAVS